MEFFMIEDWDDTEQIEYFENPAYSFLNEDKKKRQTTSRNQRPKLYI